MFRAVFQAGFFFGASDMVGCLLAAVYGAGLLVLGDNSVMLGPRGKKYFKLHHLHIALHDYIIWSSGTGETTTASLHPEMSNMLDFPATNIMSHANYKYATLCLFAILVGCIELSIVTYLL